MEATFFKGEISVVQEIGHNAINDLIVVLNSTGKLQHLSTIQHSFTVMNNDCA